MLQQFVSRNNKCKPVYLFNSTARTYILGVIFFTITSILCCHEAQTQEVEVKENLFKDAILEFLEKIPQAAGGLNIGPLRIHPSLKITETNDDNVLDSSGEFGRTRQDFYETYEPEISLELPLKDHKLNFDYGFEILEYHKSYNPGAIKQDRVSRDWGGSADLNFANGFSVHLSDRVNTNRIPGRFTRRSNQLVADPVDGGIDEGSEVLEQFGFNTFTRPRQFTRNKASVEINLPDFFNKIDFILRFSNTDISYKTRSFKISNDRNTNTFAGTIKIKPLPKIEITTGIEYHGIRYDKTFINDSVYRTIPFNILWKATAKSYFFLNTSYNRRDYGNRSIFSNFAGYDTTMGYRFNITERDNLLIKLERSLVEQQFQRDPDNFSRGDNNPQDWTQINMEYTHQFPRRFSVTISPSLQQRSFRERQNFPTKQPIGGGAIISKHQKITSYGLEVNGKYTAPREWLFGKISYEYVDERSNIAFGDLIKNVVKISVGINF